MIGYFLFPALVLGLCSASGPYVFQGKFDGQCGEDGLYYRDEVSFVFCANGNSYIQPCAPGTKNSPYKGYHSGKKYHYNSFCEINLITQKYLDEQQQAASQAAGSSEYNPKPSSYTPQAPSPPAYEPTRLVGGKSGYDPQPRAYRGYEPRHISKGYNANPSSVPYDYPGTANNRHRGGQAHASHGYKGEGYGGKGHAYSEYTPKGYAPHKGAAEITTQHQSNYKGLSYERRPESSYQPKRYHQSNDYEAKGPKLTYEPAQEHSHSRGGPSPRVYGPSPPYTAPRQEAYRPSGVGSVFFHKGAYAEPAPRAYPSEPAKYNVEREHRSPAPSYENQYERQPEYKPRSYQSNAYEERPIYRPSQFSHNIEYNPKAIDTKGYASRGSHEPSYDPRPYGAQSEYKPSYDPKPEYKPTYDPKPKYEPSYDPKPKYEPTYDPKPKYEPSYDPKPKYKPTYDPKPKYEPSYDPKPKYEPSYNPKPNYRTHNPVPDYEPGYSPKPERYSSYDPSPDYKPSYVKQPQVEKYQHSSYEENSFETNQYDHLKDYSRGYDRRDPVYVSNHLSNMPSSNYGYASKGVYGPPSGDNYDVERFDNKEDTGRYVHPGVYPSVYDVTDNRYEDRRH